MTLTYDRELALQRENIDYITHEHPLMQAIYELATTSTFGNTAGIITPIAIGYILKATGSFNWALVYVSAHAALAIASYLLIVGEIKRVELKVS